MAVQLARQGQLTEAIATGEIAVLEAPDDPGLRLFVGMLHTRRLDLHRAVPHLQHAAMLVPADPLPKIELARVLIGIDELDRAVAVIRQTRVKGRAAVELSRLLALVHHRRGEHKEAAALYRQIIAQDERDFESWAQLGHSLLALGNAAGAVEALQRSLHLKRDQYSTRLKLVDAQAAAGMAEEGLADARGFLAEHPRDVLARITVARLEDLLGRPAEAERMLREALAIDPAYPPALLAFADLLERSNQVEEMGSIIARIEALGLPPAESALIRARYLYRSGAHEAALAAAASAPMSIDAGSRAQLVGQISDRTGRHDEAFAAFVEMNRLTAAETAGTADMARSYRDWVGQVVDMTTAAWYQSWPVFTPGRPAGRRAPVFMFGFPRSGTTLLDTMLMGHPEVAVIEERPVLHAVSQVLGSPERIADLDDGAIEALRARYFAEADAILPGASERLVIDKVPLGIVDTALAHRIFPDAKFIFVERHPCDAVLSCFITRFHPNFGMANFLDLDRTARLYDIVLDYWHRCRAIFPLDVHETRYEHLIEDSEGQLRPLVDFLGLDWTDRLLDHQRTARERAYIGTPSYAQVSEPIYTRARDRWQRYRAHVEPVLPILAPWAERMGYML